MGIGCIVLESIKNGGGVYNKLSNELRIAPKGEGPNDELETDKYILRINKKYINLIAEYTYGEYDKCFDCIDKAIKEIVPYFIDKQNKEKENQTWS